MSLDKFQLNPFLIRELYKDSWVIPDDVETVLQPDEDSGIKHLGSNHKHILLLLNNPGIPFLTEEDLEFTGKWLVAVNLSLADVAIINMATHHYSISELKEAFLPEKLFLFDLDSEKISLPFRIPVFQVQQYDEVTYLIAPSLKTIATSNTEKKQFWNCLKNMFPK